MFFKKVWEPCRFQAVNACVVNWFCQCRRDSRRIFLFLIFLNNILNLTWLAVYFHRIACRASACGAIRVPRWRRQQRLDTPAADVDMPVAPGGLARQALCPEPAQAPPPPSLSPPSSLSSSGAERPPPPTRPLRSPQIHRFGGGVGGGHSGPSPEGIALILPSIFLVHCEILVVFGD